ncbi:PQQ-binding-like beta-propeller repeat protein, partial [Candidatus Solincola tengchongensis]|uniref:PQQ-binding-like beta-propeller repeat protein n=1 Tax=Candidatus Solincola tengchongensis TaxID=2900693 RepID=UPI00257BE709
KDGLLYVAASSGHMYCLNADGTQKWLYDSGSPWLPSMRSNGLTPPPLGKDGTLFTLKADGRVFAFRGPGPR